MDKEDKGSILKTQRSKRGKGKGSFPQEFNFYTLESHLDNIGWNNLSIEFSICNIFTPLTNNLDVFSMKNSNYGPLTNQYILCIPFLI